MIRAIVGANWGDEGKGKITDMFAAKSDIVIRFQGGANAGHTIINEHGRFAFHLMPSGVCYDHTTCIIGNGVALDINKFITELEDVKAAGLNPHLLVSERCQILMPYHILLDTYEEERLGGKAFGSTKSGINMDAVKMMGPVIKEAAARTRDKMCAGAAKLVVFCNAPEDNPFMAGAFHGPGEPDCVIHVGVSGPGAVRAALAQLPKDASLDTVAELIKRTAFKITRMGQLVGNLASERLGVPFGIVDLSLAPTPAPGDSVANILEEIGLESCGCCGTTATLAMLNDAVKKGGVMASNHVGGLSGAFIPVSEDDGMIKAVERGSLSIEKLEAMTAVCSVGIDMVVIPGETDAAVISALIADEAAIGMVNTKTTAVRVIPAIGCKEGDVLDFGGLLGYAPILPVSTFSPSVFVNRGGRIPAPLQALKN